MKSTIDRENIRLFGVEDGSFNAFQREIPSYAFLCGVETVNDSILNVRLSKIEVDGFDGTQKLLGMLNGIKSEAVLLGGITFAGFNMIDPKMIFDETGLPVIVCSGVKPDSESMLSALKKHFNDWSDRWGIVESLEQVHFTRTRVNEPLVYFEVVGNSPKWAEEIIKNSAIVSRIPESLRIANLIAKGISLAYEIS